MTPGSNILNRALRLISPQAFSYFANTGRIKQPNGQFVPAFAPPLALSGSVQPVPRNLYEQYGLDFQKNYVTVFVSKNILDLDRNVSGDLIVFSTKTFQCESKTDWFMQDGWDSILCVQIPNAPLITQIIPPDNGDYITADNLDFTITYSSVVNVSGTPRLQLTIGTHTRYADYISGSGTNTLLFRYIVVAGDSAAEGISISSIVDNNSGAISSTASTPVPANINFPAQDLSGVLVNAG